MPTKYAPLPRAACELLKYKFNNKLLNFIFAELRSAGHPVRALTLQSLAPPPNLPGIQTVHPIELRSDNPALPSSFYHLVISWEDDPEISSILALSRVLSRLR